MGRVIKHFGTKRHSGRYPWGSGEDPYQRSMTFLSQIEEYRKQGLSEMEIAAAMNVPTQILRARKTIADAHKRAELVATAQKLKDKGMSNVAIGKQMGLNESSVRSLLDPAIQERANAIFKTAQVLKSNIEEKRFIDIGVGIEQQLGVSKSKFDAAVEILQADGYPIYLGQVSQMGTNHKTWIKAIGSPDTTPEEFRKNRYNIRMIQNYTEDGGQNWLGIEPPRSVSRAKVYVRYLEEGGGNRDGLIELRRGVPEISLGNAHYAQVRIAVDGKLFMKGMAMHTDTIPDGYDIVYNVNKNKGTPDEKVFKPIRGEDNPFGAVIRQKKYVDASGKEQLSALNIVGSPRVPGSGEEGAWHEWSRTLSSQFLSKQNRSLAKRQLGEDLTRRQEEFEEIMSLTNPAVKRRMLESFGDQCDAAAVHLKAAAMPRQASHVLLPFPTVKENEVFAPKYKDGEIVALVRHPHGGPFEIPQLIVNNKNKEAIASLGRDPKDAIGIHPKVAERLSGADFDGDTVLVIPNDSGAIRSKPALAGLVDFNPRTTFPETPGMRYMTEQNKGTEMGKISNLITDMTIRGANDAEIARAVRHSMVVIDAEKHKLNYELSYQTNNIAQLKEKYQGRADAGASTLISRASAETRVPHRKPGRPPYDPETGEKIWVETGETYTKTGKFVKDQETGKYKIDPETGRRVRKEFREPKVLPRLTTISRMEYALGKEKDAYALSSGSLMEAVYADYANTLYSMGNRARKASMEIASTPYSPAAREVYRNEVASLRVKLREAYRNKPFERQAQLVANRDVSAMIRENPNLDDDHVKKIKGQALTAARHKVGAGKTAIQITDKEWEAIQAGAVSSNFIREILLNTDLDAVRQRSMPRPNMVLSTARTLRARAMHEKGSTLAEIAQALGVSTSTIERALE